MKTAGERALIQARRAARSKLMRDRWADPDYRARQSEIRSARMKAVWADTDNAEAKNRRAKLAEHNKTPAMRAQSSKHIREVNSRPGETERKAAAMSALHDRPEIQARTKAHASALAHKVNARRRARRDVVPAGQQRLYRKFRAAGIDRKEALRQCWLAAGEASERNAP